MDSTAHRFYTLRGLLAFWVLAGHLLITENYGTIYNLGFATHNDFGAFGLLSIPHFLAVDIFFMLSGYTLTLRYGTAFTRSSKSRDIDRFYFQRLKRIWPLHMLMVVTIGIMALTGVAHPISSDIGDIIFKHWEWTFGLNLMLMNAWGIIPVASWNEPAWTLSITFFLYILFPNLTLILVRCPIPQRRAIAAIFSILVGYGVFSYLVPLGSHSDGAGGMLRGAVFFICGMLLTRIQLSVPKSLGVASFLLALLVWIYIYPFPLAILHLTYPLLLLSLAQSEKSILPTHISLWLGNISFPLFISHYPLLLLLHHLAGESLRFMAMHGGILKAGAYTIALASCLIMADLLRRLEARLHRKKTEA